MEYSGKACPKICFPIIPTNFDNSVLLCVCVHCSVHVYIALVFMCAHVYEAAHVPILEGLKLKLVILLD